MINLSLDLGNPQTRSQETGAKDETRAEGRYHHSLAETGRPERHVEEDDGVHPCQADGLHQPRRPAGGPSPLQAIRVRLQVDGRV